MGASERDDSACSSRNHSVTWRSHRFGQNVCSGLGSTFTEGQARRHDAETLWGCLCFRVNAFVARTASDLRDALFSLCVQDIKLFVATRNLSASGFVGAPRRLCARRWNLATRTQRWPTRGIRRVSLIPHFLLLLLTLVLRSSIRSQASPRVSLTGFPSGCPPPSGMNI